MATSLRTVSCTSRVDTSSAARSARKCTTASRSTSPCSRKARRNQTHVTTRRVTVTAATPTDAPTSTSSFEREAASTSSTSSTMSVETNAYQPSQTEFTPQLQLGPTFASLTIFIAFAVVNRRVAAAVDRRKDREDAEENLRQAKLRSLDGSADFDEVESFGDALENARAAEAEAREVLAFLGADVRVRMPQPLGKPISKVEAEEKRVAEDIAKRREHKNGGNSGVEENNKRKPVDANGEPLPAKPPMWMTATVGFVLLILTWSATGLLFSPDPAVGPALSSEQVNEQMAMRGYYLGKYK